jgi:Peroxidase, family 2
MRSTTTVLSALVFYASGVVAFPAAAIQYAADSERDALAASNIKGAIAKDRAARSEANPGFNATAQYVSTSGQYAFVAPDLSTDQRGPCPGLNAMANHGYIPHNGVATIQQFVDGTYQGKSKIKSRSQVY